MMRSRDRVGEGRIADHLMPPIDRDLTGDQQRAPGRPVVDDLEQVAALIGVERFPVPNRR